jgi:hypothetical protein
MVVIAPETQIFFAKTISTATLKGNQHQLVKMHKSNPMEVVVVGAAQVGGQEMVIVQVRLQIVTQLFSSTPSYSTTIRPE